MKKKQTEVEEVATPTEVWRMFQDSFYVVPVQTEDGDTVAMVNYEGPCHSLIDLSNYPDYQHGEVVEVDPNVGND